VIHKFLIAAILLSSAFAQTFDHGAIVRGDTPQKHIAFVFTGGDFSESTAPILDTLKQHHIPAGLFVTGNYLRNPDNRSLLRRAIREGHYVGPHSDQHLLYCPWDDRNHSLVTEEQFKDDLQKNIEDLRRLGAPLGSPVLFIPPYEWFNADQVRWARAMNVQLFNFSPGSGSNRDYMPESDPHFVPSQKILDDILAYEKRDPRGLNGYILLLHLGADRRDKFHLLIDRLITELQSRGYQFVRIDEMLKK
jgi:peptidoglycan/xylan/chitin deacetylase (PgdA/CDA1 family)